MLRISRYWPLPLVHGGRSRVLVTEVLLGFTPTLVLIDTPGDSFNLERIGRLAAAPGA